MIEFKIRELRGIDKDDLVSECMDCVVNFGNEICIWQYASDRAICRKLCNDKSSPTGQVIERKPGVDLVKYRADEVLKWALENLYTRNDR